MAIFFNRHLQVGICASHETYVFDHEIQWSDTATMSKQTETPRRPSRVADYVRSVVHSLYRDVACESESSDDPNRFRDDDLMTGDKEADASIRTKPQTPPSSSPIRHTTENLRSLTSDMRNWLYIYSSYIELFEN